MTYTQMLFALTFDKFFFGHSPGWMSILGSSLILGPAIFVAMQKNVDETKESNGNNEGPREEEAQRGLMGGLKKMDSTRRKRSRRYDRTGEEVAYDLLGRKHEEYSFARCVRT
jgi:hypothetical protein